ncbi:hypothetical protein ACNOYE_21195 [Nannocystaceae bacterium ST9]
MSTDHEHGHHDPGGHELEAVNTKLLFRLMISLSIVTLLASMAVVQWYYSQRSELQNRNATEGSFQLQGYKDQMAKDIEGIDVVRKQILADGKVLLAPAPPAGWVHPDDLLSGGAPAAPAEPAAPAPAPVAPPTDPAIVVEGQPAGIAVPAGDVKPEDAKAPVEPKPEDAKAPVEPKPEKADDKKAEKAEKKADDKAPTE